MTHAVDYLLTRDPWPTKAIFHEHVIRCTCHTWQRTYTVRQKITTSEIISCFVYRKILWWEYQAGNKYTYMYRHVVDGHVIFNPVPFKEIASKHIPYIHICTMHTYIHEHTRIYVTYMHAFCILRQKCHYSGKGSQTYTYTWTLDTVAIPKRSAITSTQYIHTWHTTITTTEMGRGKQTHYIIKASSKHPQSVPL